MEYIRSRFSPAYIFGTASSVTVPACIFSRSSSISKMIMESSRNTSNFDVTAVMFGVLDLLDESSDWE